MKKILLQCFTKNVSAIIVFAFFIAMFQEKKIEFTDMEFSKNYANMTKVIEYEVEKVEDSSIPSNITKVVNSGSDGLSYIDSNGQEIILEEPITEKIIVGTGKYGIYNGNMTGYGPDCATCNGLGVTACSTRDHKAFNLIKDGVYYYDEEYGKARVLAGAKKEFPCGTIIKIENSNLGDFLGIVMDTGYDMNRFYENGKILFDVAYDTEKNEMVPKTTNMTGTVIYNVQRWGW